VAVAVELDAVVVVILTAAAAALSGAFRPLQAASLPWLVRTPGELSRANVRATVLENAGALAGPALGGAFVVAASPAVALAGATGVMALGLVALWGSRTPKQAIGNTTTRGSAFDSSVRSLRAHAHCLAS
jgi:hypothetical protein